jgi:DNA-binding response OmpR family regulator
MLTARDGATDIVTALDAGADDYRRFRRVLLARLGAGRRFCGAGRALRVAVSPRSVAEVTRAARGFIRRRSNL